MDGTLLTVVVGSYALLGSSKTSNIVGRRYSLVSNGALMGCSQNRCTDFLEGIDDRCCHGNIPSQKQY